MPVQIARHKDSSEELKSLSENYVEGSYPFSDVVS
jgi:hypothetical protein